MTCKKNRFVGYKTREVGVVISIFLALTGWIFLLKDLEGASFISASAVLLLTLSLFKPASLITPPKLWLSFGDILFFVVIKVSLVLLFFLVITPIGLVARILGKDFLSQEILYKTDSHWHKVPGSYWVAKKKTNANTMRW